MAAREIRDELEDQFGPEYEDYLDFYIRCVR